MSKALNILAGAFLAVFLGMTPLAHAAGPSIDGEVKKVDLSAGKMTIKHGPIKKLDMDAMTMVYHVKDPSMLKRVKPGDKIKFEADTVNGALTVTEIEAAK